MTLSRNAKSFSKIADDVRPCTAPRRTPLNGGAVLQESIIRPHARYSNTSTAKPHTHHSKVINARSNVRLIDALHLGSRQAAVLTIWGSRSCKPSRAFRQRCPALVLPIRTGSTSRLKRISPPSSSAILSTTRTLARFPGDFCRSTRPALPGTEQSTTPGLCFPGG